MRRFEPRWGKPPGSCPHFRASPAANPSAVMTSQTQAASAMPGVRGLVFLGFPLHPAGRPSEERAVHLFQVEVPMLFLQGTRDRLADLGLLQRLVGRLGPRASLALVQDSDHSFRVPGRGDAAVKREMMDTMAEWIFAMISRRR